MSSRVFLLAAVLLFSVTLPVLHRPDLVLDVRAQGDPEAIVAGRLGGILQTFIDRFGEPVSVNESAGPIFAAEGIGYFSVQVDRIQGTHGTEDRARVITISAPRPLEKPSLEPDPADWSIDEAIARVTSILPGDAELSEFAPTDSGQLSATCRSAALEEIFGVLTLGQCRVNLVLPTPETVSYATLSLTAGAAVGESVTPAANPCAGAVEWIQRAGADLAASQALLGRIAAIDETDPNAAATLKEIAQSFDDLAGDLRSTSPPDAVGQANYFLIAAFTAYADAVTLAAEGLSANDGVTIDKALAQMDAAGKQVQQATAEMQTAAEVCALKLGTPVAEGSPEI